MQHGRCDTHLDKVWDSRPLILHSVPQPPHSLGCIGWARPQLIIPGCPAGIRPAVLGPCSCSLLCPISCTCMGGCMACAGAAASACAGSGFLHLSCSCMGVCAGMSCSGRCRTALHHGIDAMRIAVSTVQRPQVAWLAWQLLLRLLLLHKHVAMLLAELLLLQCLKAMLKLCCAVLGLASSAVPFRQLLLLLLLLC